MFHSILQHIFFTLQYRINIFNAVSPAQKIHRCFFIATLFIFSSVSCTSLHWKESETSQTHVPYIFNQHNIVGSGLKYSQSGFLLKQCIKDVKTFKSGGILNVAFHRVDETFQSNVPYLTDFALDHYRRAQKYNLNEKKIFAFVVLINITDRDTVIREETIRFLPSVEKLIDQGDTQSFFDTCGTEFIHTIKFENTICLFVAYYVSDDNETKRVETLLKKRIQNHPSNVFQINIFKDLYFKNETYFSLHVESDNMFEPVEFPLQKIHGKKFDTMLNQAMLSILNSRAGRLKNYILVPWKSLAHVQKIDFKKGIQKPAKSTDESIYKSLSMIKNSIREYNILIKHMEDFLDSITISEKDSTRKCLRIMNTNRRNVNWKKFQLCTKLAWRDRYANLAKIPVCSSIVNAINSFYRNDECTQLVKLKPRPELFLDRRIYVPVELTRSFEHYVSPDKDVSDQYILELNKDDKTQVQPGQSMDITGKIYSKSCIVPKKNTVASIARPAEQNKTTVIINNYFPHSFKKTSTSFWKKPPPRQIIYRGILDLAGFSKKLDSNFKITKEAVKLAQKDLKEFYRIYGTHYVSQVKHHRGFVYYFHLNNTDKKNVKIIPYGVPKKPSPGPQKQIPGISNVLPGKDSCSCLSWFFSSSKDTTVKSPLLKPKNLKEFFVNKNKLIGLFKDDRGAHPVKVLLEPWSEYLTKNKIIDIEKSDIHRMIPDNELKAGSYRDEDGSQYRGQMQNGMATGPGSYIRSNGDRYDGQFSYDLMHGKGTYAWANGDKYSGDFYYNLRNGKGKMTFANGDSYEGNWKDDRQHGMGIYRWKNGDTYIGYYENDTKQGYGTYIWANGNSYNGPWKRGVREGKGIYVRPDDTRFVGDYKNDIREGMGVLTKPDGSRYFGQWKAGKMHGDGMFIWVNGNKYVGEFRKGWRHGKGTLYYYNGKVLKGNFRKNIYIGE